MTVSASGGKPEASTEGQTDAIDPERTFDPLDIAQKSLRSREHLGQSAVKRREFIILAGGMMATGPLEARAQQPAGRVYRVGYLSYNSRDQQLSHIRAFEDGLRSLGYRVGENVAIEYRFTNAEIERLPALAGDWLGSAWT
ncbi:hypothetical protein [Bradyrhizobium sp. JYMT SZCCT0428]|uniref:hypothetical protein n=1 Tax=Bradyrhizobium sp. JYMT SZCCT0428 TaxID=2807673 RepID=UPI001BAC7503|nr:hypothetical protein [Bradyrhizobium sp. JYMT SZCCT0428]MBR1157280.1 hypothetical protein [Bradyrhizobium sp. JYMT SZCCT0428]